MNLAKIFDLVKCIRNNISRNASILTIEDARNKKLDIIMTKSISRFGRNTLDTIQTLRELKDLDVTVIFDQEHLDTSKEDSEVILTTLAAFAEEENKNRRDNQNWAIKKRLKDGTSEIYSRACFWIHKI